MGAAGLRPKKRLGQNFLMDGAVATKIARLAAPGGNERVLEIGAGTGALTIALDRLGADVTAFDIDPEMVAILRAREDLARVHIEEGDALSYDYESYGARGPWIAAGNLPYNIATPLMLKLLSLDHPPERAIVMIQRDVADRLMAKPGTAAYGSLSVAVGYRARVERALVVSPAQFFPRPGVVSAVVVLHRHETPPVATRDPKFFEEVVRGSFAYRRKTLANSLLLALGIPRERTVAALASLNRDPEIRGENLDLATFAALADALAD